MHSAMTEEGAAPGLTGRSSRHILRITLGAAAGLGLGQAAFGIVSGSLDNRGEVADRVGHLVGLPLMALIFSILFWRSLPDSSGSIRWAAPVAAVLATVLYVAGFVFLGPPFDTILSIAGMGAILGVAQWRGFADRFRNARTIGLISAAGIAGGGLAGIATTMVFAESLNHALGGGMPPYAITLLIVGLVAGAIGGAVTALAWSRAASR